MASTSSEFGSNAVVLRCIGEQFLSVKDGSKTQLLTISAYNAIWKTAAALEHNPTHRAYSIIELLQSLIEANSLETIRHTTKFSMAKDSNGSLSFEEINEMVRQVLKRTIRLKSFKGLIASGHLGSPSSSQEKPRSPMTIMVERLTHSMAGQSCNSLTSLHIEYPEEMMKLLGVGPVSDDENEDGDEGADMNDADENNTWDRTNYELQDLTIFKKLDELVVENMFNDLQEWESQITQILTDSPRLHKLGLSVSPETVRAASEDMDIEEIETFFHHVCEQYAEAGALPLQLRTINFGVCIYPFESELLKNITDLTYLEEVHIRNEQIYFHNRVVVYMYDSSFESGIDFQIFFSAECPRLRQFSATSLHGDVLEALLDGPNSRQLAVSFQDQDLHPNFELARAMRPDGTFPYIETPPLQARMMDLKLRRSGEHGLSTEQVLEDLVSTNSETLEGLGVFLAENTNIDAGFENMELLQKALLKLSKLTQLSVRMSSLGRSSCKLSEATLERAAGLLAEAVPHLRYINVYWMFWRVWRDYGSDGKATARLELLDEREKEDVELFTHCIFASV